MSNRYLLPLRPRIALPPVHFSRRTPVVSRLWVTASGASEDEDKTGKKQKLPEYLYPPRPKGASPKTDSAGENQYKQIIDTDTAKANSYYFNSKPDPITNSTFSNALRDEEFLKKAQINPKRELKSDLKPWEQEQTNPEN